jgi:CDP-diacylglycerol--glycerol-3-phosphate 3-phosphatidyltransferase
MAEFVARLLARTGAHPNHVTIAAMLLNAGVAATIAMGHVQLGGVLVLVVALIDTLDGALARVTQKSTTFGAFLDSTLDRYSEGFILLGLLVHLSAGGDRLGTALCFVVLLGSLMVSYTRARAEGLGMKCEVGVAPRPERVAILSIGLMIGWTLPALAILAVLTNLTALQRILHVLRLSKND